MQKGDEPMSNTKLHFRFRYGKWHCWRRDADARAIPSWAIPSWAYIGSGRTLDAAHVHLLLQERCAPRPYRGIK